MGLNALFFSLDKVSPVGSRPILVGVGIVLTLAFTWLLTLPRRQHLPPAIGRRLLANSMKVSLFVGAATYFVLMQIVMPALYAFGVSMGSFFPK